MGSVQLGSARIGWIGLQWIGQIKFKQFKLDLFISFAILQKFVKKHKTRVILVLRIYATPSVNKSCLNPP